MFVFYILLFKLFMGHYFITGPYIIWRSTFLSKIFIFNAIIKNLQYVWCKIFVYVASTWNPLDCVNTNRLSNIYFSFNLSSEYKIIKLNFMKYCPNIIYMYRVRATMGYFFFKEKNVWINNLLFKIKKTVVFLFYVDSF